MQFSKKMALNQKNLGGNRFYQYLAALSGTLGIICSEMHYGWPSHSLPTLLDGSYKFTIETEEASWLAVMPPLGVTFGCFLSVLAIDRIGRKNMILISVLPLILSWLMIALAAKPIFLHIARFIAGIGDGLSFIVVPMFLAEIAEPSIRGMLSSMCPVAIVMGLLLVNVLGNFLSIPTTAFISSAIPLTLLVIFSWIPESPYSLLMKAKFEEAEKSLKKFRGTENVRKELERITLAVREQNENTGKFLDLFTSRSNRKAVFIVFGLRSFQQLTGSTAISFYCKTIFAEAKGFLEPGLATIVYYSVQLLLSVVASLMVDISGRRPLLILSMGGVLLSLALNGGFLFLQNCTSVDVAGFNFVPVASLLLYNIFYSLGLQNTPLLLLSELFPTNVKVFALSLAGFYFGVIAVGISKYFHFASESFGMHVPFLSFAACSAIGLIFIVCFVPETKGKTLEDIQRYLKGDINL